MMAAESGSRPVLGAAGVGRRMSINVVSLDKVGDGKVEEESLAIPKKRRSKSMSTGYAQVVTMQLAGEEVRSELSPRKKARRSLVPGRSCLKSSIRLGSAEHNDELTGNYTTTISIPINLQAAQNDSASQPTTEFTDNFDNEGDSEEDRNDSDNFTKNMTMNTMNNRRESRRVSFAPTAQMREFDKDDDDLQSRETEAPPRLPQPLFVAPPPVAPEASNTLSAPSPSKTSRRRSSLKSGGHRRRSSVANVESLVESLQPRTEAGNESSANESMAMDIADTSSVTTAFNAHFVMPRSRSSSAEPTTQASPSKQRDGRASARQSLVPGEASFSSGADASAMDLADTSNVTSAFALNTHLFAKLAPAASQQANEEEEERKRKEYQVPLGEEGITEAEVKRIQQERARKGSLAFYSSATTAQSTSTTASTSVLSFAAHHEQSQQAAEQAGQEEDLLGDEFEAEGEEEEVDMSVVDDTRRMSNVFARAFLRSEEEDEQEEPEELAVEPMYPDLSSLKATMPTPGAAGLALLDDDEEEEDVQASRVEEHPASEAAEERLTAPQEHNEPSPNLSGSMPAPSPQQSQPQPQELLQPVIPARSFRLSVVPESMAEQDEEEEEEEDVTQDMDTTSAFGNIRQNQESRRLSIAHPSGQAAAKNASPVKAMKMLVGRRRSSIKATEKAEETQRPEHTSPVRRQSGADNVRRHETGLTPNFKKLAASLSSLSPAPAARQSEETEIPTQQHPTSEPVFSEAEPIDEADEEGQQAMGKEVPLITLDRFFEMSGIQFMDTLLSASVAPGGSNAAVAGTGKGQKRRKSMAVPEGMEQDGPSRAHTMGDQVAVAGGLLPFWETYQAMYRELRQSTSSNTQLLSNIDLQIEASGSTPSVFLEYLSSPAEDRGLLESQYRLIKNYYRLQTRCEYYDYKTEIFNALKESLQANLENLSHDAEMVKETKGRVYEALPGLRERKLELEKELEKERSRQRELDECDKEHLAELTAGIAEQSATLEDFRRELAESDSQLKRLSDRNAELDRQAEEARSKIEESRRVCEEVKCYTKTEMGRLQDEFDLIQYLHSWKLVQFDSTRIELSHRDELSITLLLQPGWLVSDHELVLLDTPCAANHLEDDRRKLLVSFFCGQLQARLAASTSSSAPLLTASRFLRAVSSAWTRARRLTEEILLVSHQYPLSLSLLSKKSRSAGQPFLRASARIYCAAARAEFSVAFECTGEEMLHASAPGGGLENVAEGVGCSVDVKYGNVDREELSYIVRERLSQGGERALLEACQEAEAKYA